MGYKKYKLPLLLFITVVSCAVIYHRFEMVDRQMLINLSGLTENAGVSLKVGKILILTIAKGQFWYKELVRKNRQNYCAKHGCEIKFINELDKNNLGIDINWHKILEFIRLRESNAPYDWVWLADLDMFIMNNTIKLDDIIKSRMVSKFKELSLGNRNKLSLETVASNLDIIVAKDNANINFGSVLVRLHSNFTTKLFKAMWEKRWDRSKTHMNEQATFMYFMKTWKEEFDVRMGLVPQSTFNSYPWDTDGHYKYKQGEFVVHFAGIQKPAMANFTEQLYRQEPDLVNAIKHV